MTGSVLTVVLRVDRRRERGARALRSVLDQSVIERMEVLLYDFGQAVFPPLPGSEHASVTVIPVQHPSSIGAVRLAAFQRASAPIVAFVEEHATVQPGWAAALLHRFSDEKCAGVGGEMANLKPGSRLGDAMYVMNFTHLSSPASAGPVLIVAGNNAAYRRDVVLSLGEELANLLEVEPLLTWRLREKGYFVYLDPAVRFVHANEPLLLSYLEANFVFSRLFGALRGAVQGWSLAERVSRVLIAPVLPFIRAAKLLRFVISERPGALPAVLRGLPFILASQYASVAGQSLGLLVGEGRSRQEFLILEMDAPRDSL